MSGALYTVEKPCGVCEKNVTVTKVRSRLVMDSQDSDFCSHFKDFNPYYYTVWVCPHCGYAATETDFVQVTSTSRKKIAAFLEGRAVNVNFGGDRNSDQAIATYKLALFYAELGDFAASKLAGLYLKLGWLYREIGHQEEEKQALNKAREYYQKSMEKERAPFGGLSDTAACYLVGELSRRVGDIETALLWLGKVVGSPQAKLEPRVLNLARDAWHEARAARNPGAAATAE
ncbi:MAG TPA: DUF2225 domain-containing protein [Patescibacteria group bacterium]|nr:DUF2225 domain-containing protein [Patescibacteria group bacterium]